MSTNELPDGATTPVQIDDPINAAQSCIAMLRTNAVAAALRQWSDQDPDRSWEILRDGDGHMTISMSIKDRSHVEYVSREFLVSSTPEVVRGRIMKAFQRLEE